MARTKAEAAAQDRYNKKTRKFLLSYNNDVELDIIKWLEDQPNVCRYISSLVREDMKKGEE